jgi:SNF2 family DNA or RNA helicase
LSQPLSTSGLIQSKLYHYQQTGRDFLLLSNRCILGDDMGLGKTIESLAAVDSSGNLPVLVIAPNTAKSVWADEISKWLPDATYEVVGGDFKTVEKRLLSSQEYTIVNFEQVATQKVYSEIEGKKVVTGEKPRHLPTILTRKYQTIIIDEAHSLKNRKSARFKAVCKIVRANPGAALYLLTGTPILNRVEELWALLHLIDPKTYSSFWKWAESVSTVTSVQHNKRGHTHKVIGDPKDPGELKAALRKVMLRRLKEDVLTDLPPALPPQIIYVSLTGEQLKHYQTMRDRMYARVREDGEIAATTVVAQIVRLKQLAVSHQLLDPESDILGGAKVDALLELIEGLGDQKALVFSQFSTAIKRLHTRLSEEGIKSVLFTGDTPQKERGGLVKQFQTDPETRLFLSTIQCGGQSLTLTAANVVIFLDEYWTPLINKQARDRAYRKGQTRPVSTLILRAENSIEGWISDLLKDKQDLFDQVVPVDRIIQAIRETPDLD